jgi:hypothetical protein
MFTRGGGDVEADDTGGLSLNLGKGKRKKETEKE